MRHSVTLAAMWLALCAPAQAFLRENQALQDDDPGKSVLENLKKNRASEFETVQELKTEILVVSDKIDFYDHVERVLDGLKIKYDLTTWKDFPQKDLAKYVAVFVNCYGVPINNKISLPATTVPENIRNKIRAYVESGGFLFTSDWAISLTALTFPEFLTKPISKTGTKNETIPVHPEESGHPFLKDVFTLGKNTASRDMRARWMIEAQSRTFGVVPAARHKVKILLVSEELKSQHGSNLVGVTFTAGQGGISTGKYEGTKEGAVLHVIGHFYQQELGNKDNDEVAKMYQMILNFIIEAKKTQKSEPKK